MCSVYLVVYETRSEDGMRHTGNCIESPTYRHPGFLCVLVGPRVFVFSTDADAPVSWLCVLVSNNPAINSQHQLEIQLLETYSCSHRPPLPASDLRERSQNQAMKPFPPCPVNISLLALWFQVTDHLT